jgi:hypothetical protein
MKLDSRSSFVEGARSWVLNKMLCWNWGIVDSVFSLSSSFVPSALLLVCK